MPSLALRHHARSKKAQKHKRGFSMDYLIYGVAILSPIMTMPQLMQIWVDKNVAGVSLLTWSSYTVFAAFWLIYGLVHKEKPIIVSNIFSGTLNIIIVIGIISAQNP